MLIFPHPHTTGFVIDFISIPVIAGFTSAAAITIATQQVKGLLGLEYGEESAIPGIAGDWIDVFTYIDTIRYQDTILGCACIVVLLAMRVCVRLFFLVCYEQLHSGHYI